MELALVPISLTIWISDCLSLAHIEHYKISNENCKHENWEKVEGGLTRTFQGTLFLILLCELNGPVKFRNRIFLRLFHENYVHSTLQTMFIFEKKQKKIGVRAII